MAGQTKKFSSKAAPFMAPGEHVKAAAKVDFKAGLKMLGGAVGGAVIAKMVRRPDDLGVIAKSVPTKKVSTWVLTNQRMLFFKVTPIKLSDPIAVIELAQVTEIVASKAKVMHAKLAFSFTAGSSIELDLLSDREVNQINESAQSLFGSN